MKVYEILETAFGLAGEKLEDFPDKKLAVIWLNTAVAEAVKAENAIRERKGMETTDIFAVQQLSDEVDMDAEMCRICLPFAVAASLYSDRENDYLSAQYRNRFIDSLQSAAMGQEKDIADCYGGEV